VSGIALEPEPGGAYAAFCPWASVDSHVVDIREREAIVPLMEELDPEVVFHLAAQALVRRGCSEPGATYAVNVVGTSNVLEAARYAPSVRAAVVVTSDKVYSHKSIDGGPFREDDRLGGADPYSASKAAAELVVDAFRASRAGTGSGIRLATARAGNVIGGGDRGTDRLLPDAWTAVSTSRPVRVRNPASTRPWQFVLDPLSGYLLLAERVAADSPGAPHAVNFGPDPASRVAVSDVVDRVLAMWGEGTWESEPAAEEQPSEAQHLSLDASLARSSLAWAPRLDLDEALRWTVEWWRAEQQGSSLRALALDQIARYEALGP
jgi:CDP-glucose 4,6-dehydratase